MFIIETRTQETETRRAGDWRSDGMGPIIRYDSKEEAEAAIDGMRSCGPDWAAAEYRVVEAQ